MPKGYWVVTYRTPINPDVAPSYAKHAGPAIAAAGGRFLVRTTPTEIYESGLNERVVVIEFDSVAQAIAAHDSPAYGEALKALGAGNVDRDIRIVEGIE